MQVEQAIFTSARTRRTEGYHLTARSPGIDDPLAQALSLWNPSHGGLLDADVHAESLNYFSLPGNWEVVARSIYGGPEYSHRGGLQIVTRMLVLRREQLAGYRNNPLNLVRTALALGHLRLQQKLTQDLKPIELPAQTVLGDANLQHVTPQLSHLLSQLLDLLRSETRVAISGADDPQALMGELYYRTRLEDRLGLSFSTGLKPTMHRTFRVQFLPGGTSSPSSSLGTREFQQQLAAQEIECFDMLSAAQ